MLMSVVHSPGCAVTDPVRTDLGATNAFVTGGLNLLMLETVLVCFTGFNYLESVQIKRLTWKLTVPLS